MELKEFLHGLIYGFKREPVKLPREKTFEERLREVDVWTLLRYAPTDIVMKAAIFNGVAPVVRMVGKQNHRITLRGPDIHRAIGHVCGLQTDVHLTDRYYVGIDKTWLQATAEKLSVDDLTYVQDRENNIDTNGLGDCDEFGVALSGLIELVDGRLAFGRAYGNLGNGQHYFNVFVAEDRDVYYIEPQTNGITKLSTKLRREDTWVDYIEM